MDTLSTHTGTICGRISALAAILSGGACGILHVGFEALRPIVFSTSSGAPITSQGSGTANYELRLYKDRVGLT